MSFIPGREADLLDWSRNFDLKINDTPDRFGLSIEQATDYNELHTTFQSAYHTATTPETRTRPAIIAKNAAKRALIQKARELAGIIQHYPGTTDVMRANLGLTVPDDEPTPVPPPSHPPLVLIGDRYQRTVTLKLRDSENPESRAKPEGVSGATIFSWVGDQPPTNIAKWKFVGNTGQTTYEVEFALTVPLASKVWFVAFWFNPRKQSGPACNPISAYLDSGMDEQSEAA